MKRTLLFIFSLFILFLSINSSIKANTTITVGATAVPHAEILEFAKPILAKKGIDLKIIVFQDYIMPNKALAEKEIDANYYQHIAFLKQQEKEFGYKFVNLGNIHIEPMGLYSERFKSIKDVKDGTVVLFSNSVADTGRMLLLLQDSGLIKLKKFNNKYAAANATFEDVIANPKHLKFKNDIAPSMLPAAYLNDAAGLVFINTNFAVGAGINPSKDALLLENGSNSIYSNILVAREDNAKNPALKTLIDVLHSKEVQSYIKTQFKGAIVPVK
ncbi:MetQ/NlpA family ABC transporter substrate-binding protein [Rickettsiales bacterium LUAb2]